MTTKPTGLAAFTKRPSEPERPTDPVRRRAKGDTVALTTRISRADWVRLRQLADAQGLTLQILTVNGLSKVLAEHGLPPLSIDANQS
jgi:hypothetical protein